LALTDGVFAIAITLLVIEISVPLVETGGDGGQLLEALGELWPSFLAYLLGFLTIGVWWLSVHSMGTLLEHVDHVFLALGVVYLAGIGFIPFTAGFLAEYMGSPHDQQRVAVVAFASWQLVTAVLFHAHWRYAVGRTDLFNADVSRVEVKRTFNRYLVGPLAWMIMIGVALINSTIAIVLIFVSALSWLVWAGVPPHDQTRKHTRS
jgi:uncharacterized membrane protein